MQKVFWTYDELLQLILAAYPGAVGIKWLQDDLMDLWMLGAPHPRTYTRRMILPSQWKRFARDVGQRIGREMMVKVHV